MGNVSLHLVSIQKSIQKKTLAFTNYFIIIPLPITENRSLKETSTEQMSLELVEQLLKVTEYGTWSQTVNLSLGAETKSHQEIRSSARALATKAKDLGHQLRKPRGKGPRASRSQKGGQRGRRGRTILTSHVREIITIFCV